MIFVDELKEAWGMVRNPGANTKKERSVKDSILFFYKSTFLLLVVGVILLVVAGTALLSLLGPLRSSTMLGGSAGAVGVLVAVFAVVEWLLLPIGTLIGAGVLHLFGKYVFRVFKKPYSNTFTASIYTSASLLVLYLIAAIISAVLLAISPILGLIGTLLFIIVVIWGIVVGLLSLANQQGITWVKALLVEVGMIVVIVVILIVFAALFGGL